MQFENKIVLFIVFVTALPEVSGEAPIFRVLAPKFVCPNTEAAAINKPDNTIITIKTDVTNLELRWSVRWIHLDRPSQRFTLLLWKSVRGLEAMLNAPQPEPYIYIIDNAELLQGVEYIFNVTSGIDSENSITKTFSIENIKGDPTLLKEGRSEKLSVLLIGGDTVFVDMVYAVDAEVITCSPTQDYYFAWSVRISLASPLRDRNTSGSRLEIPPYSLKAGVTYYVSCAVYRNSGELVTQTDLQLQVLYRGLAVSLNFDVLVVTASNAFEIRAMVENHDHNGEELKFEWSCEYKNKPCEKFENTGIESFLFSRGLHRLGEYEITLTVSVQDQEASSNATIIIIEPTLPVIQIEAHHLIVNEHTMITLVANASNILPSCTLTWYFANEEYLASLDYSACDDCQDGEELSGSVSVTSIEENFLNELADFTNETEWRQVEGQVAAEAGRARFVVRCGCSLTFNCDSQGSVHADLNFKLNESPKIADIKVSPEIGTAMETVFRLSTLAASDPDRPLRYSFYCSLSSNDTLLLASNLEHMAAETFLPFIDASGTKIWVEACDSLGACSSSEVRTVQLLAGEGRTLPALVDSVRGHVGRCEMMQLRRLVQSAVSTYTNTNQEETLSKFTMALFEAISTTDDRCIKNNRDYPKLLDWLIQAGIDGSSLIE